MVNTLAAGMVYPKNQQFVDLHVCCMGITLAMKVLESCSNVENTQQVFESEMKQNFLVFYFL